MVLAGLVIAVGVVVDDAIIDVENIVRRLRQHRAVGWRRLDRVGGPERLLEVRGPIVYATLIIVAAAVPVFLLDGLTGAFFRPLALSYTLAVMASMLVALTVTPALALILLRNAPRSSGDVAGGPGAQARVHAALLVAWSVRPRGGPTRSSRWSPSSARGDPAAGPVAVPRVQGTRLPRCTGSPSPARPPRRCAHHAGSKELHEVPGVHNCGAHIGQAFLADEVVGVNLGENWISIDPSVDYDKTVAAIEEVVDGLPGPVPRDVQTYLKERIEEVITGGKEPIVVRVYGEDLTVLREKAAGDQKIMGRHRGRRRTTTSTSRPTCRRSGRGRSRQGRSSTA